MEQSELHAVLGAGQVGKRLARYLQSRGHRVRVLRRSERVVEGIEDVRAVDLRDEEATTRALQGAKVVYNCTNAPNYHRWESELPPLFRNAWRCAARVGAQVVMLDNLYRYGRVERTPFDETTPRSPCASLGRIRHELAAEVEAAAAAGEVRAHFGLAADFYGPGAEDQSLFGRAFLKRVAAGKAAYVLGNPDLPRAYSYIPDVVRGLATLGERPAEGAQSWHLPVAFRGTTREFVNAFAVACGTKAKARTISPALLRAVGWFYGPARAVCEMAYQWDIPYVPDDTRFRNAFGVEATEFEASVHGALREIGILPDGPIAQSQVSANTTARMLWG